MPNETVTIRPEAAPSPSLESNLDFWQQKITRLEAEADTLAGTNQFPEWWHEDTDRVQSVIPQLKEEGADLSNVSRYYDLYDRERRLKLAITDRPIYGDEHPFKQVIHDLGEELVGRAFRDEAATGSLHTAMIDDLERLTEPTSGFMTPELKVLREAYGLETITELLGIGGDEYSDKLHDLLRNPNPIRWIRYNEEEQGDESFKWEDRQEAARAWMSKAVEAASGMGADEAADYVFSASRRGEDEDILKVIQKFDHFGTERIQAIADFTGIHGLEAYTVEQLERMEALAHNPGEIAEQLSQHDVIAVFVNRVGDHNGVMRNTAADFDDSANRTLFFEINTMDDIYRRMVTLRRSGVKPSTLVLAAHSAPGQFMVSDNRERDTKRRDIATVASRRLVEMVNAGSGEPGDRGYSMHGMAGMARLVERYMRPSQAIDDPDSDAGRKKIIFQACHAASEAKVADLDENGEKVQIGMESVISQLGKDLITSGVGSNVDIYGAPGGIQLHGNETGVHYTGQPVSFDDALEGRPPLHAERIRIEAGNLTKDEVFDIPLRKAA